MIGQLSTYWSRVSCAFDGSSWSSWAYWQPFTWNYHSKRFLKLHKNWGITITSWDLQNRVACIEKPHTMHGACNSVCVRCIYEQSGYKRPHQVLGSPWGRSAIRRNESIDVGKSQRLPIEGNARINKVLAMRPGLAKIIDKVCISRYFKHPETDCHIAANDCSIYYTDTWLLKWVHWLSKSQSMNRRTTYYGCEDMVDYNTGVAWASLLIARIYPWVAHESQIHWYLPTFQDTECKNCRQVCHGGFKASPVLDPVDVDKAYRYSVLHYYCVQWYVQS